MIVQPSSGTETWIPVVAVVVPLCSLALGVAGLVLAHCRRRSKRKQAERAEAEAALHRDHPPERGSPTQKPAGKPPEKKKWQLKGDESLQAEPSFNPVAVM